MKKKLVLSILSVNMLTMAGCATSVDTTIYPAEGNMYHALSTSVAEKAARKDGLKKADSLCKGQGKSYIVVSQNSEYHGMDPNIKKVASLASDAAFFTAGTFVPTGALSSDEDYKITTIFKCQ